MCKIPSLSARRVWIEIGISVHHVLDTHGHSLRGECGLKSVKWEECSLIRKSLSARRVWIEIPAFVAFASALFVTLCEESVD